MTIRWQVQLRTAVVVAAILSIMTPVGYTTYRKAVATTHIMRGIPLSFPDDRSLAGYGDTIFTGRVERSLGYIDANDIPPDALRGVDP